MTAASSASAPRPRERTSVLGVPVDVVETDDVVRRAIEAVECGTRLRIGVVNHNKCWLAARDEDVRAFLESAELVVPETSAVWAGRVLGTPRLTPSWGVALMRRLLREASDRTWTVYLVGARQEVLDDLSERISHELPGIELVGRRHGYMTETTREAAVEAIAEAKPDLLFAGMGSPRQERFLRDLDFPDGPRVSMGVGGSFDVLAGHKRDAPEWIRGSGLEWLHRSLQSPRLFRRYAIVHPWFVFSVLRERLTGRVPGRRDR